MSGFLPPEILDLIVDKSWVPRARKHLFAHVQFHVRKTPIEWWKETFPDPSNSPAHHARSIVIHGPPAITATNPDVGGLMRTFYNVIHLRLEWLSGENHQASLVPSHGFSPALRSFRLTSVHTFEFFDLVCSFPLLKDLTLASFIPESNPSGWNVPLTSPKLTGSLGLRMVRGTRLAARRLLDLPDGLHFMKITVLCSSEDLEVTTDLVSRCSDTLEFLAVLHDTRPVLFPPASVTAKYLTIRELRRI